MGAYANHCIAEAQRQQVYEDTIERERWVCERAEELKDKWPEDLTTLANPFQFRGLPGISMDEAQDAYADLVHRICTAKAEFDWKQRDWMGPELFTEYLKYDN